MRKAAFWNTIFILLITNKLTNSLQRVMSYFHLNVTGNV